MPTSEARILANRINSSKSTGPITARGKEISRKNGLKHGMTGRGIVVHEEDVPEVQARHQALRAELAPKSALGAILVGQMATLSVRMERGARQEFAAVAARVRHAEDDFDEARAEAAEQLLRVLADDPRKNLHRLRKSPEGVEALIEAWHDLREVLTCVPRAIWNDADRATMTGLLGLRVDEPRAARLGAWTRASWGDPLAPDEAEGVPEDREARKAWARARLLERIDQAIAELEEHYETLDFETYDRDRAEAGSRALFDPSQEAARARRYEAEARRGFFRSLKEFRQAEAEAAAQAEAEAKPAIHCPDETSDSLASSCDPAPPAPDDPDDAPDEGSHWSSRPVSKPVFGEFEAIRGRGEWNPRVDRAVPVPA